jgi:hypothetical protein
LPDDTPPGSNRAAANRAIRAGRIEREREIRAQLDRIEEMLKEIRRLLARSADAKHNVDPSEWPA